MITDTDMLTEMDIHTTKHRVSSTRARRMNQLTATKPTTTPATGTHMKNTDTHTITVMITHMITDMVMATHMITDMVMDMPMITDMDMRTVTDMHTNTSLPPIPMDIPMGMRMTTANQKDLPEQLV